MSDSLVKLVSSSTMVSPLFASLPRDVLRRIWERSSLLNGHISLITSELSPFHLLAPGVISIVRVNGSVNSIYNRETITLCCHNVDKARRVLRVLGSSITKLCVSAPETRGPNSRHDFGVTDEYAHMLLSDCPFVTALQLDYKYRESRMFCSAAELLLKRLGRRLTYLKLTSNGSFPRNIVRIITNRLKVLERLVIKGCAEFPDFNALWPAVGRTLQYLDLSEYGSSFARHTPVLPDLIPAIQQHCQRLAGFRFRPGITTEWHQDQITSLCESLGSNLLEITLWNMKPSLCQRIVSACPNLEYVDLSETDAKAGCMQVFGPLVRVLMVVPKATPDVEALAQAARRCSNVRELVCRFEEDRPNTPNQLLAQPWRAVETLILYFSRNALRREIGTLLGANFQSLRQIYFICSRLETPDTLDALVASNKYLQIVDISMEFGDKTTYAEVQDDEVHQEIGLGIAKSLECARNLRNLNVYERMVRSEITKERVIPLRGALRDAFLPMYLRGVAVCVYGGVPRPDLSAEESRRRRMLMEMISGRRETSERSDSPGPARSEPSTPGSTQEGTENSEHDEESHQSEDQVSEEATEEGNTEEDGDAHAVVESTENGTENGI